MMGATSLYSIRIDRFQEKVTEESFSLLINSFQSPLNEDVERFLKKDALDFTKKKSSITYLVFSTETKALVGYFSIALKAVEVDGSSISKSKKRKIERVSERNKKTNTYFVPAYLIAQLGKNFSISAENMVSGNTLLSLSLERIRDAVEIVGGTTVFLEASPNEKLLEFYHHNRFTVFGERTTGEGDRLIQLLRTL